VTTPTIVSVTHTTFSTDATAHLVDMPATVVANELLLCFLGCDGGSGSTVTTPSGWALIGQSNQSTNVRGGVYGKIATGSEGGTQVDFVTSVAEQAAAQVYRIQGNVEITSTDAIGVVTGSNSNAGVTTIDPTTPTASWGADTNLFISSIYTSTSGTLTSGPSGWSTPTKTNEGSANATNSAQVFTSYLASSISNEDPGVWTLSATGIATVYVTIVIRPKYGTVGLPVNTVAGTLTNATSVGISVPSVASGRILLITAHARRASTTLAPDDPTISDTSGSPLTWTPVFSTPPVNISGANPSTKAQWWWAVSDGNAHNPVTVAYANAATIAWSVADFTVGAGATPVFTNQASGGNAGTGTAVTVTYPSTPTTGMHFLSFFGAGGSASTIATGYLTLTSVASSAYRTGYDITPVGNTGATMGASFPGQQLLAVNITESFGGGVTTSVTGQSVTVSVGTPTVLAVQNVTTSVTGLEMTSAVGTADAITSLSVTVSVTGVEMSMPVRTVSTRTIPGALVIAPMTVQASSTTTPTNTLLGGGPVNLDDLIFVNVTMESAMHAVSCTDSLGHTYTATSAGMDAGSVAGRAFYTVVTNPGYIEYISITPNVNSSDNMMISGAVFQGPFQSSPLDANPTPYVNFDLVAPYDAPPTGTLAQASEMIIQSGARSDTVNLLPVAPFTVVAALSSSSGMRSLIGRHIVSSTASVTPTSTSASDPAQNFMGTYSFKFFTGAVDVTVTGQSVTVSVGTVTAYGIENALATVTGLSMNAEMGSVTVTTPGGAVDVYVNVTGVEMAAGTRIATVRTTPGSALGGQMANQVSSVTNPVIAETGGALVESGDLVYVTFGEQNDLTVTGVTDNLGHTYTPCNAGSDNGSISGRSFYCIVTIPGQLTQLIAASGFPSSNNAILAGWCFQGPFSGVDANPLNTAIDTIAPYDAPSTGPLTQPDELIVAWGMRNDNVNILAVLPFATLTSLSTGNFLRTNISRTIVASTSSVTPQFTSVTDPFRFLSGTTSFKFVGAGTSITVPVTGSPLDVQVGIVSVSVIANPISLVFGVPMAMDVGTVTVSTNTTVTTPGRVLSLQMGTVTVNTTANVSTAVTGQRVTSAVGNVSVVGHANVPVTGVQMGVSVGTPSIIAGFGTSATVTGQQIGAMVGTVTVRINATAQVQGQLLSITVGDAQSAIGTAGVRVWNGTSYVRRPAKVWSGSTWVQKSIKHWNGSSWV
jgi:hypothetical protein